MTLIEPDIDTEYLLMRTTKNVQAMTKKVTQIAAKMLS